MVNRREFIGIAAGAGAALALSPRLDAARQSTLIQRAIPSTGEKLPIISFNPRRESDSAGMKEILKTLVDNGGKVIGFPHGSGDEIALAAAGELGIQNKFVWAMPVVGPYPRPADDPRPPKADPATVRAQIEQTLAQFKVPKVDVMMVGAYAANVDPTYLGVMREMKKEGRVRYVGVHHLAFPTGPAFGDLQAVMRNEAVDFVATDYHLGDRRVEEEILPLAQERKIGFMAHFVFDRGRIFKRVSGTPLPEWAAEFDAKTWPQFFLKYVISHPGVTVARTGTTKAAHMLDNIGGGIGRLPNEAMRKRMAAFVDSLPR
jgi:aryl-alcohol dehydrogenase-like predicted oxidoreductase